MSDNKLIQPAQAGPLLLGCLRCLEFSKGQSGIKATGWADGVTQDALERLFPPSHKRPVSALDSFAKL